MLTLLLFIGCDGQTKIVLEPSDNVVVVQDLDGDGYTADEDCDDSSALINPSAPELCDGQDNNCNDEIDEGFDADADGHLSLADCAFGTDCDDSDATINPDAEDIPYDGIDQDCSGADSADTDGDGYDASEAGGEDCDDSNPLTYEGAPEICDSQDNNCDAEADEALDEDGDGFDTVCGGD